MVNNIRAQCARNENPPKPEPIRTSAMKRVRNSTMNTRKISLTCHSIRTEPPPSTGTQQTQTKAERNLLDPGRKSGGRLRSPLPSPIPSPVQSPIPSPSRNRFQVSRVLETSTAAGTTTSGASSKLSKNSTTSPMTPPSSNSCSPTSFFPNPKSRFRVTTVVEPSSPMTTTSTTLTKHKSVPDNLINKCMITASAPPTPTKKTITNNIATTTTSQTKESIIPPEVSMSSAASTITTETSANTNNQIITPTSTKIEHKPGSFNLPYSKSQPDLTSHALTTTASVILPQTIFGSTIPVLSNSFDSPDMEVKRYMDDSGSSISSMDSIDQHHDYNNTSMSSMESFDLVLSGTDSIPTTNKQIQVSTKELMPIQSHPKQHPISIFIDESSCSMPSKQEKPNSKKIRDSLSSLETSTCSSDSLYGGSQDSSTGATAPLHSSNEGTLTNSPVGPCSLCIDDENNGVRPKTTLIRQENSSPNLCGQQTPNTLSPNKQEKRIRKTSWISPITKSDSGYPATLDKLLSLFHPTHFFTRQTSNNHADADASSIASSNAGVSGQPPKKDNSSHQQENKPIRKESPMGGLFAWTNMGSSRKDHVTDEQGSNSEQPNPKPEKSIKSPLKTNLSPENTITPSNAGNVDYAMPLMIQSAQLSTGQSYASVVGMPEKLQKEMKENISPEHTITTAIVMSTKSQIVSDTEESFQQCKESSEPIPEKVRFEVGGDDDEDDDEDDAAARHIADQINEREDVERRQHIYMSNMSPTVATSSSQTSNQFIVPAMSTSSTTNFDVSSTNRLPHGLGQITRDSLSILKGNSKSSQDSMRSLESLTELESNVFK